MNRFEEIVKVFEQEGCQVDEPPTLRHIENRVAGECNE